MINDRIELNVSNHIAHVRFARGQKMNALDEKMFSAIHELDNHLRADSSIRAVVVSGDGGNFCAGLDKSNFESMLAQGGDHSSAEEATTLSDLETRTHGIANGPQYAVWMWRQLPMPVIAAIEGVAFGGGLQIALGADFRFAAPDSKFSIMELKWGIIPDMSSTQIMRHLVRDDVIRELTYTARVFDAQQALQWGFISSIHDDPIKHALDVAQEVVQRNPHAVRAAKKVIEQSYYLDQAQGLIMESVEQDKLMGKANQIEAVMSVMQGRQPKYQD